MAVTIITFPDAHALTKGGRMLFEFQGNNRVQSTGTPARTRIQFAGPIPDGTILPLQWNGKKESITFRTNPSAANEFPAGDGSIAYARDVLAPCFASYFPFRADFESHASDFGTYRAIVLTALQAGPAFNVVRVTTGVAAAPGAYPITVDNFLPGAVASVRDRYSVSVELFLQRLGTSGNQPTDFERITQDIIDTDESGLAQYDAGETLNSYLQADLPDFLQNQTAQGVQSGRKYYIAYAEAYGSPVRPGRFANSATYQAYLGGVDFEHRAGGGFMLEPIVQAITVQSDRALRFGGELRYILPYESQWLTFLNTRTLSPSAVLRVQLLFANGTSATLVDLVPAFTFGIGQKWTIGVGPLQLRLYDHVPVGTTIQEYSVRLMVAGADPVGNDFLSRSYRYILGYQKERYIRHFAYINSLGCIDTLTTFGKGTKELERVSKQAERGVMPASYELSDAQLIDYDISLQQQEEVTTGYRSEIELRSWNDFYRSALRYQVTGQADGSVRAIQIGVLSKTIKQLKDGDTLLAHSFQFAQLHRDEFYTPDDESDPLPPYGLVVAGDPVISFSTPTIVRSVDDTVPSAARRLTDDDVQSLRQLTGEGLHSAQGYLKQALTDDIYYRQDQKIDYQTDIINTPVIPEISVPDLDNLSGYVTGKALSVGGIIRNTQPVPITNAMGLAAWSANTPDQNALEMMFPEDVRAWLGVLRTVMDGLETGQSLIVRKNANGTVDAVGKKLTIADAAANGFETLGPLGAGFLTLNDELPSVEYASNHLTIVYNSDLKRYVLAKIDAAKDFNNGLGVLNRQDVYNLIKDFITTGTGTGTTSPGTTGGTALDYYIEEVRCYSVVVVGAKDSFGFPTDPTEKQRYFTELAAQIGLTVDTANQPALPAAPTETRYSARIRQIVNSVAGSPEHIVFGAGETPTLGGMLRRFIVPTERITAEVFGTHSLNACGGTGTAPAYAPPAPKLTYDPVRLWKRRAVVSAPVYRINFVAPVYEKSLGLLVGQVNAYGPNFCKLEPLDGQNFTDTGLYATTIADNSNGMPGTFVKYYAGPPQGRYLFSARSEGSSTFVTQIVTVARSGNAPVVAARYPDQVASLAGDVTLAAIAGAFSDADGDQLTYTASSLDGTGNSTGNLPAGLSFNATAARPFTVGAAMPNGQTVIRITARDPDGNSVSSDFLLTVNRRSLSTLVLNKPASLNKGTGAQLTGTATYTDGSTETITSQGLWYITGIDNIPHGADYTINGCHLGVNGLLGVATTSDVPSGQSIGIILQFGGMQAPGSIQIIGNAPVQPVVSSIRAKANSNNWILYIKTDPATAAGSSNPPIYYRIRTANGGSLDGAYPAWNTGANANGLNVADNNANSFYNTVIFSQTEQNNGYRGLVYANTFSGTDTRHNVYVQFSMNADGSSPIEVTFEMIKDALNQTSATGLYPTI